MFTAFRLEGKTNTWEMSITVVYQILVSVSLGLVVGILIILTFKNARWVINSPLTISTILFFFGYFSFGLAQALSYSGLIAANIAGLFVNIFMQHNI